MEQEILDKIKLRPGTGSVSDALLKDMITDCVTELREFLNYKGSETLPAALQSTVKELVLLKINQDGVQGIQSETQGSGGSVTYLEDIPKPIKQQIYRHRKLRR